MQISRKRLKLGSCNFHHTVAHPSRVRGISFILKFRRDPPSGGVKQGWVRVTSYFRSYSCNAFAIYKKVAAQVRPSIAATSLQTLTPGSGTVAR